jgi:hypothetical protein
MIKLTLSGDRGTILLNPRHILSITEGHSRNVVVRLIDGISYEVREPLLNIQQMLYKGIAANGNQTN